MKKTKIMVLSDHPLSPSGVGTQTKYMIEALLKTGRYQFICLGGAMKHVDYSPVTVDPYGKDFLIVPVDGYGNPEVVRSALRKEKPDILWFMTDPRFYEWLWEIEDEVRALVPMVYYHVWDNFPVPMYNKVYYDSTDYVVSISKVTEEIVKTCSPDNFGEHISHAVNSEYFKKITDKEQLKAVEATKQQIYNSSTKSNNPKKKIFFWNNRNARRKQSGTLIWWFKEWLDKVGHDKAMLLMHTDARDQHGQDLPHIIQHLGLKDGQVLLSTNKVQPAELAVMYNAADYTINISDAEGFGLSTLESLACGTPIIVNMTGGLQEQVTNGSDWFGWGIQPTSKSIIGSLQVPYIYEDRISQLDFEKIMNKALKQPKAKYNKMAEGGMKHVKDNFSFEKYEKQWVNFMDKVVRECGSWDTRKNYKRWHLMEVA
jgi:glycosyltransferase involved in cell wall biosynthesis